MDKLIIKYQSINIIVVNGIQTKNYFFFLSFDAACSYYKTNSTLRQTATEAASLASVWLVFDSSKRVLYFA